MGVCVGEGGYLVTFGVFVVCIVHMRLCGAGGATCKWGKGGGRIVIAVFVVSGPYLNP